MFDLKTETQTRYYNRSKKVFKIVPAENVPPIFCHLKALNTEESTQLGLSLWKDTKRASESDCAGDHATLMVVEMEIVGTTLHNFIGTWSTSSSHGNCPYLRVIATWFLNCSMPQSHIPLPHYAIGCSQDICPICTTSCLNFLNFFFEKNANFVVRKCQKVFKHKGPNFFLEFFIKKIATWYLIPKYQTIFNIRCPIFYTFLNTRVTSSCKRRMCPQSAPTKLP